MAGVWKKAIPQLLPIPVRAGQVEVVYTSNPAQIKNLLAEVKVWERSIMGNPSPLQRDSLELARNSITRWQEAHRLRHTADSIQAIREFITDSKESEVRVLAVARATWRRRYKTLGLCTFRRTWCNNVCLDVVAAHPGLDKMTESPISGLGTGLLHHVCSVAAALSANAVWGECTQNTKNFYRLFWDTSGHLEDLIILPATDYLSIKSKIEAKWHEAGKLQTGV
jgi:hypothetical protein